MRRISALSLLTLPLACGDDLPAVDGTPCIRPLVLSFAADPTAPLDDACLATLLP